MMNRYNVEINLRVQANVENFKAENEVDACNRATKALKTLIYNIGPVIDIDVIGFEATLIEEEDADASSGDES